MAVFTGTKGAITVDPTGAALEFIAALNPHRWALDMSMETTDATPFLTAGNNTRSKLPGLSSHSGSAEGFLDDTESWDEASTFDTPVSAAFVLTAESGQTYSFTGYITGFSVNVGTGETASWSCTFEATGAVVIEIAA